MRNARPNDQPARRRRFRRSVVRWLLTSRPEHARFDRLSTHPLETPHLGSMRLHSTAHRSWQAAGNKDLNAPSGLNIEDYSRLSLHVKKRRSSTRMFAVFCRPILAILLQRKRLIARMHIACLVCFVAGLGKPLYEDASKLGATSQPC